MRPEEEGAMDRGTENTLEARLKEQQSEECYISKRFVLVVLLFLGWCLNFSLRLSLSVSILAMASSKPQGCAEESKDCEWKEFTWSSELQGIILGSFFVGFTVFQIPAGLLSLRFGGCRIFGYSVFVASVVNLIIPVLTRQGVVNLIALRALQGFSLGATTPSTFDIVSKWSPWYERSIMYSVAMSGVSVGSILGMAITGLLLKAEDNWPFVFYVFGVMGVLWYIAWAYLVYDTPHDHPTISKSELQLIGDNWSKSTQSEGMTVPWKALLTSAPVWAYLVGGLTANCMLNIVLTIIPQFIKYVLAFDTAETGLVTSLPYVVMFLVSLSSGFAADILRKRQICSTEFVRKSFCFCGLVPGSVALVCMGYTKDPLTGVILLNICVGLIGLSLTSACVNCLDITTKYSGILTGICNAMSGLSTTLVLPLVGALTTNQTASEWQVVFYIAALVSGIGCVIFIVFGSGEEQHWGNE